MNYSKATINFKISPFSVLSRKILSLVVWRWIASEAKIYKQNPAQITYQLRNEFGINIAENTVR